MLYNRSRGIVIARRVRVARGLWRGIGLMFRRSFDGALVFENVGKATFHGFFCFFPILLLCVRGGLVVDKKVLRPWRVVRVDCDAVVELDARKRWPVEVGEEVSWNEAGGEG